MNPNSRIDSPRSYPGKGLHLSPDNTRPTNANLSHGERNMAIGGKPTFDQAAAHMVKEYGPLPAIFLIPMVLAGGGIFGDSIGAQVEGGSFGQDHDAIEHLPKVDIQYTSFRGVASEFGVGQMGKVLVPDQNSSRNIAIRTAVARQLETMGYDTTRANIVTLEVLSAANAKAQREGRAPQFTKGSGTLTIVGAPDSNDSDDLPDFFVVGGKNRNGDLEVASGATVENLQMAALIQGKDGFGIPTVKANDGNMEIVKVTGSEDSSAAVQLVKPDGEVVEAIGFNVPGVASSGDVMVDGGNIFSVATPVNEALRPESEVANFDLGVVLAPGEANEDGSRNIENFVSPAEFADNEGAVAKWLKYFDAERLGFDESTTQWILTRDGSAVMVDSDDHSRIIAEWKYVQWLDKNVIVWNAENMVKADGDHPLMDVSENWALKWKRGIPKELEKSVDFIISLRREAVMALGGSDMMYGSGEKLRTGSENGAIFSSDGESAVIYLQLKSPFVNGEGFVATRDNEGNPIILFVENMVWEGY